MANKTFNTRIKNKRDTSANWTSKDPVLLNGEIIIVDTASGETRFKIGDGTKKYSQLPFQDEAVRALIDSIPSDTVQYTPQTLTDDQKSQARANIGAISEAELVQSDWNQNDEAAKDYIKNRICYEAPDKLLGEITFTATSANAMTHTNTDDDMALLAKIQQLTGKGKVIKAIVDGQSCVFDADFDRGNFYFHGEFSGSVYYNTGRDWNITINNTAVSLTTSQTYAVQFYHIGNIVKIPDKFLSDKVFEHPVNRGTGENSVVEGTKTTATNTNAHAEGYMSTASGAASHAEGHSTIASGKYSHAEGSETKSAGDYSHTSGRSTQALGRASFVVGNGTVASEGYSTVLGSYNIYEQPTYTYNGIKTTFTVSTNNVYYCSRGFSFDTTSGNFTLDSPTTVYFPAGVRLKGYYFSESITSSSIYFQYGAVVYTGGGTSQLKITEGFCKLTSAKFSQLEKYKYAQIIGNGFSSDVRSNAYTLDWLGNAWYAGDVYIGSTSGINKDEGSKKLATEEYVDNNTVTIDTELSDTSTNPVQNKAVKTAIDNLQSAIDGKVDTTALNYGLTQVTNDVAANYVKYTAEQTLTDEQKTQARENIGAICESDVVIFPVRINYIQGGGMANKTAKEIYDAHKSGKTVIVTTSNNSQYSLSIASMNNNKYQICFSAVKYDSDQTQTSLEFYYLKDASESATGRYTFYTYNFDSQYVKFTAEQTLTDDQKAKARENINAPSPADAVYTVTASSTDGVAYTATVPGITSLTAGASFIMIPDKTSSSQEPTLNVNGLGAKKIRRRLNNLVTVTSKGYSNTWISVDKPFSLIYDGTYWIVEGMEQPVGADMYGTVPMATADANGNNIADTSATIAMLQSILPKVTTINLVAGWGGNSSPYYQDVTLGCCTETSVVDLQPTPTQLASWQDEGLAFTTQSGNGTVRVYVAGGKPSSAISIQVKVQEVVEV